MESYFGGCESLPSVGAVAKTYQPIHRPNQKAIKSPARMKEPWLWLSHESYTLDTNSSSYTVNCKYSDASDAVGESYAE